MALKKLLNKGTVYKRSDNRWGGMVSYHDEQGVYRRKCFCASTKKAVLKKIGDYIKGLQSLCVISLQRPPGLHPCFKSCSCKRLVAGIATAPSLCKPMMANQY